MLNFLKNSWRLTKEIRSVGEVLPVLMTLITRHNRMRVDIKWSDKSWVHNIFRVYEMLFWRREGIRAEATSFIGEDGKVVYYCHSFEAALALFETKIREMLTFNLHLPVKIWIPMLATPQGVRIPVSPYLFAIAYDVHTEVGDTTSSSQTWSHTITGSNTLLVVYGWARPSPTLSSITYAASASTNITSQASYLNSDTAYMNYKVATATGANNIVATLTGSALNGWQASSFTGAKQTGQPDAFTSDAGDGSSNNFSLTLTTVADNCWMVGGWRAFDGTCSAGANTVVRGTNDAAIGDNGVAQTPAGSHSMNMTGCGNRVGNKIVASFAPAVAAGPANLKTYDTNPKANIKTMNTNPIANVKTFDTNP